MKWVWIPAGLAAALTAAVWTGRADRATVGRIEARIEGDRATSGEGDVPVAAPSAEGDERRAEWRGDYIVAGRVVDSAGRPMVGADVHLRQGSG